MGQTLLRILYRRFDRCRLGVIRVFGPAPDDILTIPDQYKDLDAIAVFICDRKTDLLLYPHAHQHSLQQTLHDNGYGCYEQEDIARNSVQPCNIYSSGGGM